MTLSPFLRFRSFGNDSFIKAAVLCGFYLKQKSQPPRIPQQLAPIALSRAQLRGSVFDCFFDLQDNVPITFSAYFCVVAALQDGFDSLYHFITVH
jgi:hypothetical protein